MTEKVTEKATENEVEKVTEKVQNFTSGEQIRAIFAISVALVSHGFSLLQLFSYAGFLIIHFGLGDRNSAGYYVGNLAAIYMVARVITSIPFGYLCDYWGRKPVFYISLVNLAVSSIGFGFSETFAVALLFRLFLGLLNGLVIVSKTSVSEICSKEYEAIGMSTITLSWNFSLLIAPGLGGILYNQGIFGSEERYPHLIPNIVTSIISLLGLFLVWLWVPETLSKKKELKKNENGEDSDNDNSNNINNTNSNDDDEKQVSSIVEVTLEEEKDSENKKNSKENNLVKEPSKKKDISLSNNYFVSSLLFFFILSFAVMAYDEVFNLWGIATIEKGGLGWSSSELGIALTISAIVMSGIVLTSYGPLSRAVSFSWSFTITSFISSIFMFFFPLITILNNQNSTAVWILSIIAMITAKAPASMCFSSVALMLNHSVAKSKRGKANGIAMCIASVGQSLAPIIFAPLFAWSIDQANLPLLVFGIVSFFMALAALVSFIFNLRNDHNHKHISDKTNDNSGGCFSCFSKLKTEKKEEKYVELA